MNLELVNHTLPSATVVITGSGTVTCQSVIKALRSQSEFRVTVVTLDAGTDVAGRYFSDAFYRVPLASHPDFVDAVLDVCRRHHADMLIPIVDYEFGPISLARDRFRDIGCLPVISSPPVIATVNDKRKTFRFFRDHGFGTAETWDADEARRLSGSLPYPVFLKPAVDGRSSLDCYRVENPDDLELYLDRVPNALVQEFVDAPEYTSDVLAGWDSRALGVVVRERLETKGGVSYKGRTVDLPELRDEVVRMVSALGIQGPANIQAFVRRPDSGPEILFSEINPRFSGALALSLAAGLNGPLMLLKLARGMPIAPLVGRTRVGLTMLRYWDEVFVGPDGRPEYPQYDLQPAWATEGELRTGTG